MHICRLNRSLLESIFPDSCSQQFLLTSIQCLLQIVTTEMYSASRDIYRIHSINLITDSSLWIVYRAPPYCSCSVSSWSELSPPIFRKWSTSSLRVKYCVFKIMWNAENTAAIKRQMLMPKYLVCSYLWRLRWGSRQRLERTQQQNTWLW